MESEGKISAHLAGADTSRGLPCALVTSLIHPQSRRCVHRTWTLLVGKPGLSGAKGRVTSNPGSRLLIHPVFSPSGCAQGCLWVLLFSRVGSHTHCLCGLDKGPQLRAHL